VTCVFIDSAEASVIGASNLSCGAGRWRWPFTSIWWEVKNQWSSIFTPPICLLGEYSDNFTFKCAMCAALWK